MQKFTIKILISILILLSLTSCGDSIRVIAVILSESQSSDLQTFSYTIKATELEDECDASGVTVTIFTLLANGNRLSNTHSMGDISKGGSVQKTFTVNTNGDQINIFAGASMAAVEGDAACSFLGL